MTEPNPDALALAVYTVYPAATIADAAGAALNTTVVQTTSDLRPKGSKAIDPIKPAADKMPADPSNYPKQAAWYGWVIGGAAAVGIAAIGVSMFRKTEDEEALFPETV